MSSSLFIPSITAADSPGQAQETVIGPTGNDNGGGGGGLANRGANYFFGFLITFVVLLLVFVGCGIGSRRRYLARREAMFVDNMEPWAVPGGMGGLTGIHGAANVEYKPPILYEPLYEQLSYSDNRWGDIKPLAVVVIRRSTPDVSTDDRAGTENQRDDVDLGSRGPDIESQITPRSERLSQSQVPTVNSADHLPTHETHLPGVHNPHRPLLLSVVSPLGGLRPHPYKPNTSVRKPVSITNTVPEALQVSIMIAMPSPNSHSHRPTQSRVQNEKAPGLFDEKQDIEMVEIKRESPIHLELREDVQNIGEDNSPSQDELLPEYQIGVTTIPWFIEG